jgi:serine phosphatase RsbU (regulator of sigma subunit)
MNIDSIISEAWTCRYSDTRRTIELSDVLLTQNDERSLAWGKMLKAIASFLLSKEENYLELMFSALDWFEKNTNDTGYPACLYYLGNIYESFGNYDEALTYTSQGLSASEAIGFSEGKGDALSIMGMIYSRLGNYKAAIENYEKSIVIRSNIQNYHAVASVLNQIARCYVNLDEKEKAEEYYLKSLNLRKEHNDKNGLPWTYLGLASLYEKYENKSKAKEYYNRGLELNKDSGDFRYDIHAETGLARILIIEHEYVAAEAILKSSLTKAMKLQAKPLLYEVYELLADLYESSGRTAEALFHFREFHRLKEEVISAETHRRISQQQITFAVEKTRKEAEIIHLRNVELKNAFDTISHINKDITDSINYAFRIQRAVMPPMDKVKEMLPESFIFWRPRDIVSGDFYFCEQVGENVVFSAIDCTGHGVPGALLSIAGFGLLSQAVNEKGLLQPSEILKFLDEGINKRFHMHYKEDQVKDAMDISLCTLNVKTMQLQYSGAYNALYYVSGGEMNVIKADAYPIGVNTDGVVDDYTNHSVQLKPGDCVYLITDGYADQFGGPKGRKFMYRQLRELFVSISQLPMAEQYMKIEEAFDKWKGSEDQVDDVLIFGVKIL